MTEGNLPARKVDAALAVETMLKKGTEKLLAILPKSLTPDRFIANAISAVRRVPRLLEADPKELCLEIIMAAQVGCDLAPAMKEGYLIPFRTKNGTKVQLLQDYRFLVKKARESGAALNIWGYVVYEGDDWDYQLGDDPKVRHKPSADAIREDGNIVAAYAVASLPGGGKQVAWLWRDVIEKRRRRGRAADDGPWITDYAAMCVKTAIRDVCNLLRGTSPAFNAALAIEDAADNEDKTLAEQAAKDFGIDFGESVDESTGEVIEGEVVQAPPPPRPSMPKPANGTKKAPPPPEEERPPDRPPAGMFGPTDPLG